MATIIGLSGSLRRGSFNTALLRAAVAAAPPGFTVEARTLHGIPLYDGDVEAGEEIPSAVSDLKEAIVAADGTLIDEQTRKRLESYLVGFAAFVEGGRR